MNRTSSAAGIFLLYAAFCFLLRSPALDEWDSVQFALGVGDFNLWKHQPHPPGYPLYIAFGWVAERLLGLNVHDALALGSALGGGLFVAGWFVLVSRRFALPVAGLAAVTLAGMVITFMSATKVITDPLGAGLITLALVIFDREAKAEGGRRKAEGGRQPWWRLASGGLTAAAAVGVRPQNFAILLLIVVLAIIDAKRTEDAGPAWKGWTAGLGAFFGGCLAWLVPVLAIQARTPESGGNWWAYGNQLVAQWRWRLDQPKAFLGAMGGQDRGMLLYRLDHHFLGWITRGFGFSLKGAPGWLGLAVLAAGWTMYVLARRDPAGDPQQKQRRVFWRMHLPWAGLYVLMIFCCLPGDQRYYLPIFPLLIVPSVAGWWSGLLGPWRWAAAAVPLAALLATLPLVGPNHRDEPPPVRLLRWLEAKYPPAQRGDVWLFLTDSRRHADWYAPDFHIVKPDSFSLVNPSPGLEQARAVYTDDPLFAHQWPGSTAKAMGWEQVGHFERSPLIYRKHNMVDLYLLDPFR